MATSDIFELLHLKCVDVTRIIELYHSVGMGLSVTAVILTFLEYLCQVELAMNLVTVLG